MLETPQRVECTGSDTLGYATLAGKSEDNKTVAILISDFNSEYSGYKLTVDNLLGAINPSDMRDTF